MSLFVVLSTSDSCPSSSLMQAKSRQLAAGGMSGCRCDRPHSLCRCRPSARPHAQSIPIRGKVQFQVPSRVIHGEDLPRLMLKSISIQFQVLILYQYTQRQVCKSDALPSRIFNSYGGRKISCKVRSEISLGAWFAPLIGCESAMQCLIQAKTSSLPFMSPCKPFVKAKPI